MGRTKMVKTFVPLVLCLLVGLVAADFSFCYEVSDCVFPGILDSSQYLVGLKITEERASNIAKANRFNTVEVEGVVIATDFVEIAPCLALLSIQEESDEIVISSEGSLSCFASETAIEAEFFQRRNPPTVERECTFVRTDCKEVQSILEESEETDFNDNFEGNAPNVAAELTIGQTYEFNVGLVTVTFSCSSSGGEVTSVSPLNARIDVSNLSSPTIGTSGCFSTAPSFDDGSTFSELCFLLAISAGSSYVKEQTSKAIHFLSFGTTFRGDATILVNSDSCLFFGDFSMSTDEAAGDSAPGTDLPSDANKRSAGRRRRRTVKK